jgi:hypothetical protein
MAARALKGDRDRKHNHYLRGSIFCERCRKAGRTNRLYFNLSTGRTGDRYGYVVCRGRQKKVCDLPPIPVEQVEDAIQRHHANLEASNEFTEALSVALDETLADLHGVTTHLQQQLHKQLGKLASAEDNLINLAAEGVAASKIRVRLNKIEVERHDIEERLKDTGAELSVGSDILRAAVRLLQDPVHFYEVAPDSIRRRLNQTYFEAFYINEHGEVDHAVLRSPFDDIHDAQRTHHHTQMGVADLVRLEKQKGPSHKAGTFGTRTGPLLADVFAVSGWNKTVLVELRGFEPLTSSMPWKRATNCAKAPRCLADSGSLADGGLQRKIGWGGDGGEEEHAGGGWFAASRVGRLVIVDCCSQRAEKSFGGHAKGPPDGRSGGAGRAGPGRAASPPVGAIRALGVADFSDRRQAAPGHPPRRRSGEKGGWERPELGATKERPAPGAWGICPSALLVVAHDGLGEGAGVPFFDSPAVAAGE